jgi:hypothetical protein
LIGFLTRVVRRVDRRTGDRITLDLAQYLLALVVVRVGKRFEASSVGIIQEGNRKV